MSRIGRTPIAVPAGVTVTVDEKNHIVVKGPKGTLERDLVPVINIEVAGAVINVTRPNDEKKTASLHGLTRTLVANMVEGVTNGFSKTLDVLCYGKSRFSRDCCDQILRAVPLEKQEQNADGI